MKQTTVCLCPSSLSLDEMKMKTLSINRYRHQGYITTSYNLSYLELNTRFVLLYVQTEP